LIVYHRFGNNEIFAGKNFITIVEDW